MPSFRKFNGIQTHRETDGGKNPQAKTGRKKEIFEISLWSLCDSAGFWENRLEPKKVEKIPFFVECSLSFTEFWWEEARVFRACVLFVEALFFSHAIALD